MLVEGAGSASEVNLRANDIANMGFARAADVPVVLIGDIDRGGVIASLVGTKAVIDPADAALIRGFLVNKFRGDPALFADGMTRDRAGDRLGGARPGAVLPRRAAAAGGGRARARPRAGAQAAARSCASRCRSCRTSPISTISIRSKPSPRSSWCGCGPAAALPGDADLVILPGSKATIADLAALRAAGFDIDIAAHRAARRPRARAVRRLPDARPHASPIPTASKGRPAPSRASACSMSRPCSPATSGSSRRRAKPAALPFSRLRDAHGRDHRAGLRAAVRAPRRRRAGGAVSADGRVIGTYVHGLFADDRQRSAWLARLGAGARGHRL